MTPQVALDERSIVKTTPFRGPIISCRWLIVMASLQVAAAILLESTLSFLGVGVPPPTPTWGTMVAEGRPYVELAWWTVTFPGLAIMLSVLCINLLGDNLRDFLDPKFRQRS